ncbi:MAG: NnrU family protein [Pseudomonadota bacterium]
MGWIEYLLAIAAFFASHSLPLRPSVRARIEALFGKRGFSICYSCASIGALVWLIVAAGRAPFVQLWPWAPWQNWAAIAAMLVSCLMITLAAGRANPFSFGGGSKPFDPRQAGLVRWMRHPLLMALALWSLAHVLPNGNLAHVFLFGLFGIFALIGQRAVDRRKRRIMGETWQDLRNQVAASSGRFGGFAPQEATVRLLSGVGLFLLILASHKYIIGVSPLP